MINPVKAAHVAAFFLAHAPHKTISNLKLMKLFYLAERECMRTLRRKMIGGQLCIMKGGPVLSDVYRYMTRDKAHYSRGWRDLIERTGAKNNYQKLRAPLDCDLSDIHATNRVLDHLSRNDIAILGKVQKKHGGKTANELVKLCHEFGEYKDNENRYKEKRKARKKDTSIPMDEEDVFVHFKDVDAALAKRLAAKCREDDIVRETMKSAVTYRPASASPA